MKFTNQANMRFLGSCLASVLLAGTATATTIEWGNEVFDTPRDSFGNPLDDSFYFQLGFFSNTLEDPFVPDASNLSNWSNYWRVFDQAIYNPEVGYFTSRADLLSDGSSSSAFATVGINFSGQDAYLWARNFDEPIPGAEWLLVRADNWTFPTANPNPDCCDNDLPIQWAVSDLTSANSPIWGSQSGVSGEGDATNPGDYSLQTFIVPEPSSALLALIGTALLAFRRRRAE